MHHCHSRYEVSVGQHPTLRISPPGTTALTPCQEAHADLDDKTHGPAQDAVGPWEREDGETNILAEEEQRRLLPRQCAELDVVPLLLRCEHLEGIVLAGDFGLGQCLDVALGVGDLVLFGIHGGAMHYLLDLDLPQLAQCWLGAMDDWDGGVVSWLLASTWATYHYVACERWCGSSWHRLGVEYI